MPVSSSADLDTGAERDALPATAATRIVRDPALARAHPIADGLWGVQLPLPYQAVASVNAYLVAREDGWMLVDCGSVLAPGWAAVEVALARARVDAREIRLLVLSHAHADHRGLAHEVATRTGCAVAAAPGPHPLIDSLRDPDVPRAERRVTSLAQGVPAHVVDRMIDDLPGDDRAYPAVTPDRILAAGATVPSVLGDWEAIPAPGHSADQIVLWNAGRRILISADLALAGPASFLEYGTRPDPHGDQLASLDRALGLEPELLFPGHGRPVTDPVALLTDCREKTQDRAELIRSALGARPLSGWEIATVITPPGANADHWQRSLAESLAVLEHLEAHGQARHVVSDAGVRSWLAARH